MDIRVGDRGHSDGFQDARERVDLDLLHAAEAGIQGVGAHQPVGPSEPGA